MTVRGDLCAPRRRRRACWPASPRARKDEALERRRRGARAPRRRDPRENAEDLALARKNRLAEALVDRLLLDEDRLADDGRRACAMSAALPDPVGEVDDGLAPRQRPRAAQASACRWASSPSSTRRGPTSPSTPPALCLKTGNAVILRGGSAAKHSNRILCRGRPGRPHRGRVCRARRCRSSPASASCSSNCSAAPRHRRRHPARRRSSSRSSSSSTARSRSSTPPAATATSTSTRPPISTRPLRDHHQRQVPATGCVQRRRDAAGASRRRRATSCRGAVEELQAPRGRARGRQGHVRDRAATRPSSAPTGRTTRPSSWRSSWPSAWSTHSTRPSSTSPPTGRGHSEAIVTEDLAAARAIHARSRCRRGVRQRLHAVHRRRPVRPRRRDGHLDAEAARARARSRCEELTCLKYVVWGDGQVRG